MTHITLSVPNEVHKEMKRHPEIKWSEIVRRSIMLKVAELKKTMKSKDFLELVDSETRRSIEETPEKEWKSHYSKTRKTEWKRAQYLTQT